MKDLSEIRQQIDQIDQDILTLYEKRLSLAEDVAAYKISQNKNVYDREREKEKLAQLSALASDDFSRQGIVELFEQIMSVSKKKQYRLLAEHGRIGSHDFCCCDRFDFSGSRVVFQGVEGAYSQQALRAFFGDGVDAFAAATWREAMERITGGEADYAVLPIENSTAGIVAQNYDLLVEYDVAIIGEQVIRIDHALLGCEGAELSGVRTVYSHPQALMQCASYLEQRHPEFETRSVKNTAVAARKIKDDGDPTEAAIAGAENAKLYGLRVLEKNIQDNKDNQTKFIIVSREKKFLRTADKVSLSFELPNETGSLYHILSHFIFNGLNMTKIESRPRPGRNWDYRFFIDFQGNLEQEDVRNALRGLKEETDSFKILGNYPAWTEK